MEIPEYLAFVDLMNRDLREQARQARKRKR